MAKLVRALRSGRSAGGSPRFVLRVPFLSRRRSADRSSDHPRRRLIGPRRGARHELRQLTTGSPDSAAELAPAQDGRDRPSLPHIRPDLPSWPLPPERRLAQFAPSLRRIYRRGRRALSQVRKQPNDESWRELGQRSKDLWRVSQLLQPATPKRMKKVTKRARRLSNLLGEDRELAQIEQRLADGQLSEKELKLLRRLISRRRDDLQGDAQALARRLYRRKPRKFARRLGLS
jgi:hypothetical protein